MNKIIIFTNDYSFFYQIEKWIKSSIHFAKWIKNSMTEKVIEWYTV